MKNLFLIVFLSIFSHNILASHADDIEECEGIPELSEEELQVLQSDLAYYKAQCKNWEQALRKARKNCFAMCAVGGILFCADMYEASKYEEILGHGDDTEYVPWKYLKVFGKIFWIPIGDYIIKNRMLKYYQGKAEKCRQELDK